LNGEKIAVFPEKRRATFHEMDDYRLRIPLAGKIRNGRNILALTLTIIGRHNMGNPLFAGVSHPIVLYRERHVVALADWEFIDFTGRQYTAEDLDAASPALLSGKSRHVDLSDPPAMRDADLADWLDIRCIYREVEIPASMKGRPLFLECGKMDDAWCYVNGKPVGRAYHQMSATFDLSEFSREQSISIVVVGRFYWRACCIPSIVPRLVSSDTVLSTAFLRRDGADGERGRYFDVTEGFESASPPPDAQALWMHRKVCVEIPSGIVAPMFVELDESWSANALIYWNGVAIGRYSVVGPDRRFYIASGILKEQNDLVIYVDGYSASARAGEVKVGPYNEYSVMRLS